MPKIRSDAHDDYDDEPVIGTRQVEARQPMRETRDAEVRSDVGIGHNDPPSDYEWRRPTALDAPPPRVGYVQRWVRMKTRGEEDTVNWSNKFREGWRPREPATLPPEFRHLQGVTQGMGGAIAVGSLVLCEMPEQILQSKRRALAEDIKRMEQSVTQDTDKVSREGARFGAPPVVRDDRQTVERGRRPSTMAD